MESTLERTLAQLPDAPGVYMMIGGDGQILYIGKAVSLRNRVRSYFQDSAAHAYRTVKMVERVVDVRTIVVSNEVESLILEANLIKRHQPPFNVRLRDDKRFPYLKVTNEPFPRVVFTRVVRDDGARYFGPYTNAHGLRELIDLVRIVFPLRTCREPIDGKRKRPCLQYHIKRCLAPCVGYQSEEDYDKLVDEVVLFLEGHHEALMARLQHEMADAAEHFNFEAAARLRDRIIAVRRTIEAQKVVWRSRVDMDLIAVARDARSSLHASLHGAQRQAARPGALHPRRHARCERCRAVLRISQAVLHRARGPARPRCIDGERHRRQSARAARGARPAIAGGREGALAPHEQRRRGDPQRDPGASRARRRLGDRTVAHRSQGPARAHSAAGTRRARRLPAPGPEERRAKPQGVPRAPRSARNRLGDRA